MLQIANTESKSFNTFKCGEIFCVSAKVLKVSCYLCESKVHFEQFSTHFQHRHLSVAKGFFNEKAKALGINKSKLEPQLNKENDGADNLIKIDDSVELINEGEKYFQELVIKSDVQIEDSLEGSISLQESVLEEHWKVEFSILEDVKDNTGDINNRSTSCTRSKTQFAQESIKDTIHTNDFQISALALEEERIKKLDSNTTEDIDNTESDSDWFAEDKPSESKPDPSKDVEEDLPFPCAICERSYSTKKALQKHNYSSHKPNKPPRRHNNSKTSNKCEICNEVFRSVTILRAHMWKHTGIVCDICGRSFKQSCQLALHKKRHTGVKDFKCKECNKEFFTARELKSHMVCHTKIMSAICEICGKGYRFHAELKLHMRRHTGERPAKCDVCGKCFFSGHDLNVHAVSHTNERPFKCDICGSSFQRKKALRIHKRIHSSDRKHVCRICGKSFSQSSGLNKHMRTHDAAMEKNTTSNAETAIYQLLSATDDNLMSC